MTPDELLKQIAERRAAQAAQIKPGVPDGVRLGPLTSTVRDGAVWAAQDGFPSYQIFADEVERVLSFAQVQGQFDHYLNKLRGNDRQRDSALAELRVAFFFFRNEFQIAQWEPIGASNREGEFTIRTPSGTDIFTEVKSPSWEGELSEDEKTSGRKEMGKYLNAEVRSVAPWERIRFAIDKAYGKYLDDTHNLLVIADDLFISLQHDTELPVGMALYDSSNGGYFTNNSRGNLGGVGIFWVAYGGSQVQYEMKLFLNPHALQSVILPEEFARRFNAVDHINRAGLW